MIDLFGNEISELQTPQKLGKCQAWKMQNNYRKSTESGKCCGNCDAHIKGEYHDKIYHKCEDLGLSHSPATDIRVSCICNLWRKQ